MRLPIYEIETDLLEGLGREPRLIVSAPTGSGKSTQVPQMLLDGGVLGDGQVVILQPRRLAARLLAARVARERQTELGGEVGYQIRFDNVTSAETRIRFVTEGVLLRQMLRHPRLPGVSAIVFDEFHERHLYGDITLAQALELQARERPDLKLLVMSATLETIRLRDYLDPCLMLESHGRTFPVEIEYATTPAYVDQRPTWEQAADAFAAFVRGGGQGDVLVFMAGGFEISQTIEALRRREEARGFVLLPLHGELPARDQDAAVAVYDRRKVVVATNVAETSLTIDGIRCVIDCGLARIPRYDPHRGLNTLLIEKISRAAADQRAGRAGRTAPGVCLRLWSAEEHRHRPAQELPEVKRLDLAEVVLTLKAAGVGDLRAFRWLEAPEEPALRHAEELLEDLGAIRKQQDAPGGEGIRPAHSPAGGTAPDGTTRTCPLEITAIGRKMLAFPLHPRYARLLLEGQEQGCVYDACLLAALTQGRDLLVRNVEAAVTAARENLLSDRTESDFWLLMRAWEYARQHDFQPEVCRRLGVHATAARQVGPLLQQFLDTAQREGLDTAPRGVRGDALRRCILIGFSDRVARRLDRTSPRCDLVHGRRGTLARESTVRTATLLVAAEVQEVEGREKGVNTLLSLATAIEEPWLEELFPDDITTSLRVFLEPTARRVYAEEDRQFRGLAIGTRRVEPPPLDAAARLLAQEVLAGRLVLSEWDESVDQWIVRLNLLGQWCPELRLPPIQPEDRQHLVEQFCHGAFTFKEIKDQPVKAQVKAWLGQAQQDLVDKHAPESLRLPNGKLPRVIYEPNSPPRIAVRIQELYDVTTTPRIAMGRVPILLQILAPSMRPVQITQDLAGFWRDHYPRLKQQLQRRYPRHEWR